MPIVNGLFYSGWGDPTTGLASDLLSGKTLNNEDGDNVVGTMPNNGPVGGSITQQAGKVIVPAGYTSGGQVEANISNLTVANIKQGATVGGVAGTFTADANAVAGDILATKTAYVNGAKVTGSMTNRGAITQTISTQGGQYTVPAGYHNGSGKVTASFANLVAANVRAGVDVGGVVGTFDGTIKTWTGTVTVPSSGKLIPATNIGFRPKVVYGFANLPYPAANVRFHRNVWFFMDPPNPYPTDNYSMHGGGGTYYQYTDNSLSTSGLYLNPQSGTVAMNDNGWNDIVASSTSTGLFLASGIHTVIAFG